MLNDKDISRLATIVDDAAMNTTPITMLTKDAGDFGFENAYKIQRASMALRAARGDGLVGMKMGLTSIAKMQQMGVHEPIYGHLTKSMRLEDGGTIIKSNHCHPRIEPEVAFLMKRDLEGKVTPAEALAATDGVCAALEIIDSRYENFKFTLPDVVADNASSTKFILGSVVKSHNDLDLGNLGMVLEQNGEMVQTGSSAAIYEHPARSLAKLSEMLSKVGEKIHAGHIVLAGGATAAVALNQGDVIRLRVDALGEVTCLVK